ncbi:MAG: aldo/keto reductase [Deltaproteobacteria bacterium]|nr:MAG: aldo/keto reductase [Deltaproteobacteria bacterium]
MIKGFATGAGTRSYAKKHSSLHYGELNGTELLVSQVGFGCYRLDPTMAEHENSLRKALLSGVNLIDTSSNYGDGGSEELVGTVLKELIGSEEISRDSVLVVSKVGYLQGRNYGLSQERKGQGRPFVDLVLYADGLEHCIHPEFIKDQLTRSLDRLKLETLDFYLLHNPEYYLSWANKTGVPIEEARQEYYNRIEQAFQHLETEVGRGRVRFYGISSNTFPSPASDPEFTSLEKVWEIAESISAENHFRLIQLPMNLLETGGITEKNQEEGQSVLEFASQKKLGVLINRPLNAIADNRLFRLAEVKAAQGASDKEIIELIDRLIYSEEMLKNKILPKFDLATSMQLQVIEQIATGAVLKQHWQSFGTYERWQELQEYYFLPRVKGVFQFLKQQGKFSEEISLWVNSHLEKLEVLLEAVGSSYREEAAKRCGQIKDQLSSVDTDWSEAVTLSQMAIRALRSTAGISTVLVGMRREAYVEDVIEELAKPVENRERADSWDKLAKMIGLNTL